LVRVLLVVHDMMSRNIRLALALGLGLGCGAKLTGPSDGGPVGASCSADTDCGSGMYCLGFSRSCADAFQAYTVGVGTCHRDCTAGACSCVEQADCRAWGECISGNCVALPIDCIEEPSSCPSGCMLEQASDTVCGPVCRCAVCPASDAGLSPD
jgi:hypothetical protein